MVKRAVIGWLAILTVASLSSCTTSRLVTQQSNPDYVGKPFKTVMSGLEVLQACLKGALPEASIMGGFGLTYLATDANLNLKVALKEFLPADLAVRGADSTVQPKSSSAADSLKWGLQRFMRKAGRLH